MLRYLPYNPAIRAIHEFRNEFSMEHMNTNQNTMRVLIEVHEGQVVRNLLENHLLNLLANAGAEILVVTSAARVADFVCNFVDSKIELRDLMVLSSLSLSRFENYEFALGNALSKRGFKKFRQLIWQYIGERKACHNAQTEIALIDQWKPDIVVSTHISQAYGRRLVAVARRMGIPTIGNLNSWDNVWKGLKVRPDIITCWSENNREELARLSGYPIDSIRVIGAPAFDAYFAPDAQWSRTEMCSRLKLDPNRPILLFATLGQFSQQIDETNPLEVLLAAIDKGQIPMRPQVILRMHPWSRDTYFGRLMKHPDVVVSRYENYVPGLGWTPTRDEAILAGNLLRHADVVVSPGSTMSIEPAIFDTPTIIPVFNEYMPEFFDAYFQKTWINQHFGKLHQNNWIPLVRSREDMIEAINRALADRSWYHEGRQKIREVYLGPLDGRATERLAEVIIRSVDKSQNALKN